MSNWQFCCVKRNFENLASCWLKIRSSASQKKSGPIEGKFELITFDMEMSQQLGSRYSAANGFTQISAYCVTSSSSKVNGSYKSWQSQPHWLTAVPVAEEWIWTLNHTPVIKSICWCFILTREMNFPEFLHLRAWFHMWLDKSDVNPNTWFWRCIN